MKTATYATYKSSNSRWLGDIPSHWKVKKLKFLAAVQPSNVDKKTVEGEEPVLLCNYTDVYKNEYIDSRLDFMRATATNDEIKKFSVDVGDVIVTKDSETPDDIAVPACVAEKIEGLLCGYHLTQIKPVDLDGRYLFRLFQSTGFSAQFTVAANGVTRFGLPQYAIANAFSPVPPIDEQEVVARFLDYKTTQIDALIAKKEALLAKLAEKRTALISHAVIKGLDPSVLMKDSGVEWLGKVPAHWEVKRLRHVLTEPLSNGLFKKKDQWGEGNRIVNVFDAYVSGDVVDEVSLDRVICNDSESLKYSAKHGDFFFVRSSLKLEGIGKSAVVLSPTESLVFECHLVRGRPDRSKVDPKFLCFFLNSEFSRNTLISQSNQVTMTTLDQQKFNSLVVSLPPLPVQRIITSFLDDKTAQIDAQQKRIHLVINKLQEYRSALITNAVTGKIDVRSFTPPDEAAHA
jgi:type I restriction enzyme S subunit